MISLDFVFARTMKNPLFIASFSEGNPLSTLVIMSKDAIEICENHEALQSKIQTIEKVTYSFASSNFLKLKELEKHPEVRSKGLSTELRR